MRGRIPAILTTGLIALSFLVASCGDGGGGDGGGGGGGASLAGTYTCGPEEETGQPPETWELRDDGTLAINPPAGPEGTWSVEGDSVIVTLDGQEDRFTIEGDGFVTAEGDPGGWICSPA